MNYLTTEDGKPIKETNPLDVKDSTIGTLIGEATSSPTANTLLARMKSLEDKIDGITGGTTPAVTQLSGSMIEQDPETGVKTVTSTAAEIFAGIAPFASRSKLIVYNEGSDPVYWGKGTVATTKGFPLLPGDSIVFSLNPAIDVPIFFVAETNVVVRVGELA